MASFLKTGNSYSGDTEDLSRLCRTCASSNDYLIPIFEGEGLDHGLAVKIEKYLPVKILEGDTLPSQVCYQCASTLIAWHDLFENSIKAEKKLRDLEDRKVFADKLSDIDRMKELECSSAKAKKSKKISTKSEPSQNFAEGEGYQHLTRTPVSEKISSVEERTELPEKTAEKISTVENMIDICSVEVLELDGVKNFQFVKVEEDAKFKTKDFTHFLVTEGKNLPTPMVRENITSSNETKGQVENFVKPDKDDMDLKNFKVPKGSAKLKKFCCNTCQKRVQCRSKLLRHVLYCERKTTFPPKGTIFTCDICGKKCGSKNYIRNHVAYHGEKPACHICGKRFVQNALKYHIYNMHGGIRKYHCDICNKKVATKNSLKNHIRTHTGEKPFMCSACGRCFTTYSHLQSHQITHGDILSFPCNICDKTFRRKISLKFHMMNHSGVSSCQCDICGKTFRYKMDVDLHRVKHFDDKPFTCPECGKAFKHVIYLKRHTERMHKLA